LKGPSPDNKMKRRKNEEEEEGYRMRRSRKVRALK
jgi:hypothetical protein